MSNDTSAADLASQATITQVTALVQGEVAAQQARLERQEAALSLLAP